MVPPAAVHVVPLAPVHAKFAGSVQLRSHVAPESTVNWPLVHVKVALPVDGAAAVKPSWSPDGTVEPDVAAEQVELPSDHVTAEASTQADG
jgi:hypothetical protein